MFLLAVVAKLCEGCQRLQGTFPRARRHLGAGPAWGKREVAYIY